MTINLEKLRTPHFIFLIYVLFSVIVIMIFRFIFPGSVEPLPSYSFNWRLVQGLLEVFNLFPALALSALVIPFGLASFEENYQSFSELFFKRLAVSVITAIGAAVIYSIIFLLVLPVVKNYEENMMYSGNMYRLARKQAQESINAGKWHEASQFLAICNNIWYNNKELIPLRDQVEINLARQASRINEERAQARSSLVSERRNINIWPFSNEPQPLYSTQAIEMSRAAFEEERYFDSHWLANLAGRLAVRGSPDAALAARIASDAWNMIASQAPNQLETRLYELYNLKLSGYRAMESGDYIHAYYIFQRLLSYTPNDPDAKNYFIACEQGAKEIAFFIDEMELPTGEMLNNTVFSVPDNEGRAVLRFFSLITTADIAYGMGFEYMNFDKHMTPVSIVSARYAKLIPFIIDNQKPQILILTHALDRYYEDNSYQSEWILGNPSVGGIILDISFEDLMLISSVRRGLTSLQINDLFTAAKNLGNAGYVPQIFEAEIINRIGSALFFLPVAIMIIIIAWRYRVRSRPRYIFILLLPVLPIVFNGFVFLYRSIVNTIGIWLVISAGFTAALIICFAAFAVTLFASLIALSAQHS